jgi:Holliday junction resolvase RusA-like endonuclease
VTTAIELRVFGEPQPQGNKTGFIRGGKVVMVEGRRPESREAFKDWRGGVSSAAKDWQRDNGGVEPIDAPVSVDVTFWLTKPASLPRWRWLPWSRPDVDKCARAVLDGISKILIKDDSRVVDLAVRKRFALGVAPGCLLRVEAIDERDAELREAVMGVAS